MKLLPQTLVGRTVLVLLAGLTVSHLISVGIYSGDRRTALTTVGGKQIAERIAAATQFVEGLRPPARARAVQSFWGPGFSVTWTQNSTIAEGPDDWRTRLVRSALGFYLDDVSPERVRLRYAPPPADREQGPEAETRRGQGGSGQPWMGKESQMREMMRGMMGAPPAVTARQRSRMMELWRGGEILEVSVKLSDASWLNFASPAKRWRSFWSSPVFLSIVLMTVAVLGLSVWAIRSATRPLGAIAAAADRLGMDMDAPALDEGGPREVRHVARAFNTMQRRIQTFVRDRTQMLAAISHDLRTPITRLRLRAEFIEDADLQRKMLGDLEQMEAMIASTLAFAKDDAGDEPRQPFDLAVLLQGLCDDAADAGQAVAYDGPDRLTYRGRPIALNRVFGNLIDNAVSYGGNARVSLDAEDGRIVVTVADDGHGIPDDQLDQVFAPFHRVEHSRSRETGGVGLGLSVVRSIVRAHGGEVTLANRAEGGLLATVTLPRD